jgi:peptidoglycan/xylan/chitin deacetylase (PgdA/CDA1 family)
MEVGLHGTNHVDWRKVDRAELENETTWSRQLIEEVIGKPVTSLAIPFGAYNRTVIKHLDSLSFERIYTSDRGLAVPGQRYLRRNPVMGWQTIRDIEVILEDRVSLPSRARRSIMPLLKRNIG